MVRKPRVNLKAFRSHIDFPYHVQGHDARPAATGDFLACFVMSKIINKYEQLETTEDRRRPG